MQLGLGGRLGALQHLLDQVDTTARAVELVTEQLVGRAGGGAEAAVHALAQQRFGGPAVGGVLVLGGKVGLHQNSANRRSASKMPAGSNSAWRRW